MDSSHTSLATKFGIFQTYISSRRLWASLALYSSVELLRTLMRVSFKGVYKDLTLNPKFLNLYKGGSGSLVNAPVRVLCRSFGRLGFRGGSKVV